MSRRRRIYEGKAKVLFEGPEPGTLVQYFKDDATAFNNQKKGTITGKGVLNNRISEGTQLPRCIVEYYYKSDELGDPMVSEEHITAFGWAQPQDIDEILALS